jgi:choline dehydrogenase
MALLFALALVSVAAALKITTDPTDVANKTYTHIIIGGGTAGERRDFHLWCPSSLKCSIGLTVANRLAEVSHFNILVIEAGPDGQNSTDINDPESSVASFLNFPHLFLTAIDHSDIAAVTNFSWFYNTTVQAVNGGILSIEQ